MNKDTIKIAGIGLSLTVAFAVACIFINKICALLCLVLGIAITVCYLIVTKKRIDRLEELNNYLSLVCSGNYYLNINENAEGELSILKNNLYKVITILQSQKDALARDKTYLADTLADISHQLKTPLTSIMVLIDLVKTEQDEEKRAEFVEVIEGQLDKTKWLISNLLKLSKLDAGTVSFITERVSIKELVDESLKPFLVSMDLKNITLKNEARDIEFSVDKNWTCEALMNIIKNCIEHTEKNGTLLVLSRHTNVFDSIIVRDNGVGIAEEDLPHIFERFYHGKNSSGESVGIGLALTKEILAKQNATVTVNSVEGEGTEFELRFYKSII
ncbi:MAG: sensor histidine kinase [Eubacterium sp.]